MTETLTTERLALRPLTPHDADDLFAVFSHPQAMRFMPTPPHQDPAETRAEIAQMVGREGAHAWAVCLKHDSRPIGYVHFLGEVLIPGMGYLLHPDYWGQGIIVEACRAALVFGFERLGYERVELWIDEENAASIRVAQKLGFRLRGQLPLKYNHQTAHHVMQVWGLPAVPEDPAARFYRVEPVLVTPDIARTAAFYRDKLGFRVDFLYGDPPTHGGVSRADWTGSGVTIQLSQAPAGAEMQPALALFILVGTGLDALYEAYRQQGVTVLAPPEDKPWGMRDFRIQDCDGHRLTFATHI